MRTGELERRRAGGISQKMLTQTLRELERHGIVTPQGLRRGSAARRIRAHAARPSLAALVIEIETWVTANYTRMTGYARRYDARLKSGRLRRASLRERPPAISAGVRSLTCVATDHEWPYGSLNTP